MTIKLYWHGGEDNKINFGDTLSPMIVELVSGRKVEFADVYKCDMLAIGSLLDKVIRRRWKRLARMNFGKIAVWGTGSFGSDVISRHFNLSLLAVRGPLTRKKMALAQGLPMGDPGLFIDRLATVKGKKYRWGIIPHVADAHLPIIKKLQDRSPDTTVIDLSNPNIIGVINQIAECDFIISSSLHGVIAADALGVPNVWMQISGNVNGADWKFADYFASVGRVNVKPVTPQGDMRQLEGIAGCAGKVELENCRNGLERALLSFL